MKIYKSSKLVDTGDLASSSRACDQNPTCLTEKRRGPKRISGPFVLYDQTWERLIAESGSAGRRSA